MSLKIIVVVILFFIVVVHTSLESLKLNNISDINQSDKKGNFINSFFPFCFTSDQAVSGPISDFSAIIYKDGGRVEACDFRGDIIAEGKSGLDDSAVIQAAIERFKRGGKIFIKCEEYFINSTIILNPRIRLELETGTVILPIRNIDLIQIRPRSELSGGNIDVSNIEFTESVIILDGSDKFWATNGAVIEDITIRNVDYPHYPMGNAIRLNIRNATSGHISGVRFNNIVISGAFKYGILLSKPIDSPSGWINGNSFDGIVGEGVEYFIYFDNIYDYGTDGNYFHKIQFQSLNNSKCAITVAGSYNSFDCLIWDWHLASGDYIINLRQNSSKNYLLEYTNGKVDDKGQDNIILPKSLYQTTSAS